MDLIVGGLLIGIAAMLWMMVLARYRGHEHEAGHSDPLSPSAPHMDQTEPMRERKSPSLVRP